MRPTVKVFTKEAPCTKLEIWNTFRTATGFAGVSTVIAHSQIGKNVPRVMEREGRITLEERHGVEYYKLTPEGEEWLLTGMQRYLRNHPAHVPMAHHLPKSWGYTTPVPRLRRTR